MSPRESIIVALDVPTTAEAQEIITELGGLAGGFKIGLQLFTAAGPDFVRDLCAAGHRIFLDLKFHDIPTTVAKAAVEVARLGVWMFNVHAVGGSEMLKTTVAALDDVCRRESLRRPLMIGVTVLTSSDASTLNETGVMADIDEQVLRLAQLSAQCGLDGIVASAREVAALRAQGIDGDFVFVTPGIRPAFATNNDQKRVMSPSEALDAGADFLVIGRPITAAGDRRDALERILEELTVDSN